MATDSAIKIFSTKERPFGWLSNNFIFPFKVQEENGKYSQYRSVTNYIYHKTLGGLRSELQIETPQKVPSAFQKHLYRKTTDLMYKDFYSLLKYLINTNDRAKTTLLRTFPHNLKYTGNKLDFINFKANTYSNILMKVRNDLHREIEQENFNKTMKERSETLYYHYLVYSFLKQKLEISDILEYLNTPINQILIGEEYNDLLNSGKVIPNVNLFMEEFNTKLSQEIKDILLKSLDNPQLLVPLMRQKYIPTLYDKLATKQYQNVVITFALYIAKDTLQLPDLSINDTKLMNEIITEISKLDTATIYNRYTQIKELYDTGKLPQYLTEKISNSLIPQLEDLKKAKDELVQPSFVQLPVLSTLENTVEKPNIQDMVTEQIKRDISKLPPQEQEKILERRKRYNILKSKFQMDDFFGLSNPSDVNLLENRWEETDKSVKAIEFSETNPRGLELFLPDKYNGFMYVINSKNYPTMIHYIVAALLFFYSRDNDKTKNKDDIYKILLENGTGKQIDNFKSINVLQTVFITEMNTELRTKLEKYTKEALDIKFSNKYPAFVDILLLTNDNLLVWNDKSDSFLGVGDYKKGQEGENFVGRYLMILRRRLSSLPIPRIELKSDDLLSLVNDDYVRKWITSRATDACNIVDICNLYMESVVKQQLQISPEFITDVILNVYKSCEYSRSTSGIIKSVPSWFENDISYTSMYKSLNNDIINRKNCVNTIWKYIYHLLSLVMDVCKKNPSYNPTIIIANAQLGINRININNCPTIANYDKQTSCIIIAIVNVIDILYNISRNNSGFITYDIGNTIASIILGKPVNISISTNINEEDENVDIIPRPLYEVEQDIIDIVPEDQLDINETGDNTENYEGVDKMVVSDTGEDYEGEDYESPVYGELNSFLATYKDTSYEQLSVIVESVVDYIIQYKGIPRTTKQNRINFFADL